MTRVKIMLGLSFTSRSVLQHNFKIDRPGHTLDKLQSAIYHSSGQLSQSDHEFLAKTELMENECKNNVTFSNTKTDFFAKR